MSDSDERARLFVALELPVAVREQLVAWRDGVVAGVAGLRPVAVESLHVTLCFLGWVAVREVEAVARACGEAAGMPSAELRVAAGV